MAWKFPQWMMKTSSSIGQDESPWIELVKFGCTCVRERERMIGERERQDSVGEIRRRGKGGVRDLTEGKIRKQGSITCVYAGVKGASFRC